MSPSPQRKEGGVESSFGGGSIGLIAAALFLLSCTLALAPAKLVNTVKTNISRITRKEFAAHLRPFYWKLVFWSRSYCLVSAGGAPLSVIQQYIQNQGAA